MFAPTTLRFSRLLPQMNRELDSPVTGTTRRQYIALVKMACKTSPYSMTRILRAILDREFGLGNTPNARPCRGQYDIMASGTHNIAQ